MSSNQATISIYILSVLQEAITQQRGKWNKEEENSLSQIACFRNSILGNI